MAKLSEEDLKAILEAERADALASHQSDRLTRERTRALDYYMGDVSDDIPNVDGRSKAVSSDVADTIEGLMPSLMEIFAGSDDAVRFEPVGPEDVDAADQETEYVKHVFWQKNDGFLVLYSMIKDALLTKLGIAKVWWETEEREEKESYFDQTDDQLAMILADPKVEIVEHEIKPMDYDPMQGMDQGMPPEGMMGGGQGTPDDMMGQGMVDPAMMPPGSLHDIVVKKKDDYSCLKVMAIPPEEFGVARRARHIRESHYCFHEPSGGRPAADLIAEGYDKAQIDSLPTYNEPKGTEKWARDTVGEQETPFGDEGMNRAMRPIRVTEHYVRCDYDGSGKAKLWRVVTGGEDLAVLKRDGKPDIEEWDQMPFAVITPFIMPHRVFGRSVADVVIDIMQQKTVILRGLLDNIYAANMPRPEVAEQLATQETLDDIAVWRHGAPIRVKQPGAVTWQQVPPIVNHVFPVMQYLDQQREWRTGVTRQGQGLDADALNNQSATAAMQLHNAAQARMKLIARIFAETGIKDLFWLIHATIRKHANKADTVRLTNNWVEVDPRNWKTRNDITVSVGLGQGGKTERMQDLQVLIGMQTAALEGGYGQFVTPRNLYNAGREMAKVLEQDVELFFEDPGDEQIEKPPSPEEIKAQTEMAKMRQQGQIEMAKMQGQAEIEKLQAQADMATKQQEMQAKAQLAERQFQLDYTLKMAELEMKREEHQMKMQALQAKVQADTQLASIKLNTEAQSAAMQNQMKAEDHERKQTEAEENHKRKQAEAKQAAKAKKVV